MKKTTISRTDSIVVCIWAIVLLGSAFLQPLQAQTPSLKLGLNVYYPGNEAFVKHLFSSANNEHYLLLGDIKSGFAPQITPILAKYDSTWKEVFRQDYVAADKNTSLEAFEYVNGKFLYGTMKQDKKTNIVAYYATSIEPNGIAHTPQPLIKVGYDDKNTYKSAWHVSEDTTKLLFALQFYEKSTQKTSFFMAVIDHNAQTIWSTNTTLPYTEKEMAMIEWGVSNEGKVYLLTQINNNKSATNYCEVRVYGAQSDNKDNTYKIAIADKVPIATRLSFDRHNNFHCLGFYAEQNNGRLKGVFYTRLDAQTAQMLPIQQHAFTAANLGNMAREDKKVSKDGTASIDKDFRYRQVRYQPNGSLFVDAEQFFRSTFSDPNSKEITKFVNSHDILTLSIKDNGELEWLVTVPKKQQQADPRYLSWAYDPTDIPVFISHTTMQTDKGDIFCFYNEFNHNIDLPLNEKVSDRGSIKNLTTAIVHITTDGKATRKAFEETRQKRLLIIPQDCHQIDSKRLFVRLKSNTLTDKHYHYGLITIE